MATFTAIPEKTQNKAAMKRVIDYVMQDKKTVYNGIKLVSGQNCVPETAYQEFMATKNQYGKAKGVFFKQYVQSFKPDCGATPKQIHRIGLETAKYFEEFEVIVATHIDRDHWHNHFVVNSVSCETGLKIQINEKGLEQLRRSSDEICRQFGLEVLQPYQKPKQKSLNQREYRTALKGESKKLKLTNAIDYAVTKSRNKSQFISEMQKLGYGVKWVDSYKYITYTTPDGQRFRDNRLLEEKYLKNNMEELFAYEYGTVKTDKQNRTDNRRNSIDLDRADTTAVPAIDTGAIQQDSGVLQHDWREHCRKHGFDIGIADTAESELYDGNADATVSRKYGTNNRESNELDTVFRRGQVTQADEIFDKTDRRENIEYDDNCDVGDESERFDSVEAENEMDADWLDITANGIYLAADIAMMFGGTDDNEKKNNKSIRERKNGQKKKKQSQDSHNDGGMQMNM